jgi:DNA-directed RNA polymerase subunit RPC12/RpoP
MLQGLTVVCDNQNNDGTPCGATAIVIRAAYAYEEVDFLTTGQLPTLLEARYEIQCPNCGHRRQVEKAEPPEPTDP